MKPTIPPPAMGKIVGQTGIFSLDTATGLGNGKLFLKPVKLSIKNWPCVASCTYGEVSKYIQVYKHGRLNSWLSMALAYN